MPKIPTDTLRKWFYQGLNKEALVIIAGKRRARKVLSERFDPKRFRSGGLINDVDVEVVRAEFTTEPPPNYPAESALFAKLTLLLLDPLDKGQTVEYYWSLGTSTSHKFTPSANGYRLLYTGKGSACLVRDSTFYYLMESLSTCGLPRKYCNNLRSLLGLRMRVVQQAIRARNPNPKSLSIPSVLVCERIIRLGKGKHA